MGRCANCGAAISGADAFCPKCGARQSQASEIVVAPAQAVTSAPRTGQFAYAEPRAVPAPMSAFDQQIQPGQHGAFAPVAPALLHTDTEMLVWEDRPSAMLLAKLVLGWVIVIAASFYLATQVQGWQLEYNLIIIGIAILHIGWRYWEIASISYRVSSQRLEVTQGRFSQTTVTYELMRMGENQVITMPILLRLVGRGNLTIYVPQCIVLQGIKNPKAVRDVLRRAGQVEVSRFDKIHWR